MTVELNHTIIPAKDKWVSAKFVADILGLEAGPEWSHFAPVRTSNGVTLDFADATEFRRQHYAFLVSEQEFDTALSRIKARASHFTRTSTAPGAVRSITFTAAVASISKTPAVICWKSSRGPMARPPNGGRTHSPDHG